MSDAAQAVPSFAYPAGFVRTRQDRRALAVLLHVAFTPRRLAGLARAHGSARECLEAVRRGRAGRVAAERARSVDPAEAERRVRACDARLVAVGDPAYPPELLHLPDPPGGVFVRGRDLTDPLQRVAIVGARNCSPGGRESATEIGRGLASAGVCVVSGAARGIDAAAHLGALSAGGPTVAVLGCGIDMVYPKEHGRLLDRIAHQGALVSEYPPGVRADPFRFPARNRIVAALARAVVVVEGAIGSGSMITAEHALDLGLDVYAVPGAVSSPLAQVPLKLIREGARMIRGADDLIEDLSWLTTGGGVGPFDPHHPEAGRPAGPALPPDEATVLGALGASLTLDQLTVLTAMPVPAVLAALARLELRQAVREVGGRYERRGRASP